MYRVWRRMHAAARVCKGRAARRARRNPVLCAVIAAIVLAGIWDWFNGIWGHWRPMDSQRQRTITWG